jgi:hypothetical protein
MSRSIPTVSVSHKTHKRRKQNKSHWNESLQDIWDNLSQKERAFLKSAGPNQQGARQRNEYIATRNAFDKLIRQTKRAYRYTQAIDIKELSTRDQNEFWRKIKELGPKPDQSIPIEIIKNGTINRDESAVFERWKQDIKKSIQS